ASSPRRCHAGDEGAARPRLVTRARLSPTAAAVECRPGPRRVAFKEERAMARPDISVTFPCYNEEANVARMIESSLAVLERIAGRHEVVVSNDGSRDRTREIAESYAARYPDVVRVLNQYPNRGYGHALKSGLKAGRYDWVFFTAG